jgi:expansin (peptidoglycan-binding protein)
LRGTSQPAATQRPRGAISHSHPVEGKATHYGPAQGGYCGYPRLPSVYTVAAGPDLYQGSGGCGAYLDITGPNGVTIRAKVDNECPECGPGHLDLTDEAFERLAPLAAGIIPISYRVVVNPPLEHPLLVKVMEAASQWWLAVLIDNTGNRLRSVSVRSGGMWQPLRREDYDFWTRHQADDGPFNLQVEDIEGHVAVLKDIRLAPGRVQDTSVWMY